MKLCYDSFVKPEVKAVEPQCEVKPVVKKERKPRQTKKAVVECDVKEADESNEAEMEVKPVEKKARQTKRKPATTPVSEFVEAEVEAIVV